MLPFSIKSSGTMSLARRQLFKTTRVPAPLFRPNIMFSHQHHTTTTPVSTFRLPKQTTTAPEQSSPLHRDGAPTRPRSDLAAPE